MKNIKLMAGKPLIYWTAVAACGCESVDKVYIATDSDEIRDTAASFGLPKLEVIGRSAESATDTASTDFSMLEFAKQYDFDNITLVQATSPLLQSADLERGFFALREGADSVLSVVPQKRFIWREMVDGYSDAVNYDYRKRPRRQEFGEYLVENGAFYITSRVALLDTGCRLSGKIKTVKMDEDSFVEIDEPMDWEIVERLLLNRLSKAYAKALPEIKMLLTDCDGVLTDGGMYYSENGDELKKFNTRDGMAFQLLRECGILTGIITSENVQLNKRRAEKLKLDIYEVGVKDKAAAIKRVCAERGIGLQNVAYIGDDINDIEALRLVGLPSCPADAVNTVLEATKIVAVTKGGGGVVREIADIILADKKDRTL
jgi:N-acylneuraminate cytidylyltransferase